MGQSIGLSQTLPTAMQSPHQQIPPIRMDGETMVLGCIGIAVLGMSIIEATHGEQVAMRKDILVTMIMQKQIGGEL